MKKQRNDVTRSELYSVKGLRHSLENSPDIVVIDRVFCVLISLNSYNLAGDRKQVIDLLEAALQRLGKQATPRMLQAFAKHTGRTPVYVEASTSVVEKASEPIELPEPAPTVALAAKKPRVGGKKDRKLAAAVTPEKPAKSKPKSIKLGDPAAEDTMRQRCSKGFGDAQLTPAFAKRRVPTSIAAE